MLFEDTYNTIDKTSEGLYKEKGSKFIARAFPVKTEEDVKACLADLRKEFYDARHHCYAYQLGFDKSAFRMNDDGEPSGTAGRPIFGQIQSHDLTNILIVVIRYFGGTKLGVSGLINAYKSAAKEAIYYNKIETKTIDEVYQLNFAYPIMNDVMKVMKDYSLEQFDQAFEMDCELKFIVRKGESNLVYDKLSKIRDLKIKYIRTQ
ncbi:MAG: YigZ family protein [Bacteroidetes bacterium]|nr:YigZ family protein [Bacteroidota bacterium]